MHALLKAAWPELQVDLEAFLAQLGNRDEPDAKLADLYLAFACSRGEPAALRLFEERYLTRLDPVLSRVLGDAADRDEVKQRLREKLLVRHGETLPKISTYSGRGELFAWLAVAATREAISLARQSAPTDGDTVRALVRDPAIALDPQLAYVKKVYRVQFEEAFREALGELEPGESAVLRHQLVDKLSLDEIAAMYRIHPVSAARRVTKARSALLTATRRSLTRRLQLVGPELDSLLRLVRSQVDLSLGRLVRNSTGRAKKDR